MTRIESFAATPIGVLTLVDAFAQQRGTRGPMPGPIPPVRFTLVARRVGGNLTALDPPITLAPETGASGAYLFPDEARLGSGTVYRISAGNYLARIEADFYQPVQVEIPWPPAPETPATGNSVQPILLKPGPAYPFPDLTLPSTGLTLVRGALLRIVSGAAIQGALVELINPPNMGPFSAAVTDASGGWVLVLFAGPAPPISANLRFTLPAGGGVVNVPNVAIRFGTENSLSQTAIRGAVLTPNGLPVSDAEITVSTQAGSVRSGRDGRWTFYLSLLQPSGTARVTATTPNGSSAFQDVQIQNRATTVVPAFQIAMN
jgi:hypothetical protein